MSSGHVISVYTCWAGVCTPAREYIFAGVRALAYAHA